MLSRRLMILWRYSFRDLQCLIIRTKYILNVSVLLNENNGKKWHNVISNMFYECCPNSFSIRVTINNWTFFGCLNSKVGQFYRQELQFVKLLPHGSIQKPKKGHSLLKIYSYLFTIAGWFYKGTAEKWREDPFSSAGSHMDIDKS